MELDPATKYVVKDRLTGRYWNMARANWGVESIHEAQRFGEWAVSHLRGQDGLEVIPVG
jgi:hypothetical protein